LPTRVQGSHPPAAPARKPPESRESSCPARFRNIAIIAHVDHGKTTLVDKLLQQAGTFKNYQHVAERVMDSNDIERERGITILAKNCAIEYGDTHINIVDTPGHADFGGEVERVLSMVDSVLLLVDAVEGPMPQTRFVTKKALALGLRPIVVVNKIDRPGARPDWVVNQTFDLFDKLGATDAQLDFPVVYASALNGYASLDSSVREGTMKPLFETILSYVPPPMSKSKKPLQLQIARSTIRAIVGRIAIGRIRRGTLRPGQPVMVLHGDTQTTRRRSHRSWASRALLRVPVRHRPKRATSSRSPASTTSRSARRSPISTSRKRCR
jgi:GTP-binding protein